MQTGLIWFDKCLPIVKLRRAIARLTVFILFLRSNGYIAYCLTKPYEDTDYYMRFIIFTILQ